MSKKLFYVAGVLAIIAAVLVVPKINTAQAAQTFDVNSVDDFSDANPGDGFCDAGEGVCTLRAAIEETNALAGADTINFNIGPMDQTVKIISPTSGLPEINDQVTINGFTQDDASPNQSVSPAPFDAVIRIQLDGANAGENGGLIFGEDSDNSEVHGLAIGGYEGFGIFLAPGADHIKIQGNNIGMAADGLTSNSNKGIGITSNGTGGHEGGPDYAMIGGTNPADRNIISSNTSGVPDPGLTHSPQGMANVYGSDYWTIQGNYVGIAGDGVTPMGNQASGITVDYVTGLTIGGSATGAANVFSDNGDAGISPDGSDEVTIQGNYIGTDYTGTVAIPNHWKGLSFAFGQTDTLVGGANPGEGNIIANNGDVQDGPGIFTNDAENIAIIGNSIYNNSNIGIDNQFNGVTQNDLLDSDVGTNDWLNFPVITDVQESGGDTQIDFDLDVPDGEYRVEFFSNDAADPSGYGQGQTFLGYKNVISTGSVLSDSVALTGQTGLTFISSTTTKIDNSTFSGFGPTSEFSLVYGAEDTVGANYNTSLTKTLLNPEDVAPGADIEYEFTLTNDGAFFNLSSLNGSTPGINSLVLDIAPPDLDYVSVDNSDITCTSLGEGSAATFGTLFEDHSNYEVINCGWNAGYEILFAPNSITFTMTFHVENDSDTYFTNYAYSSAQETDDDYPDIAAAFDSDDDIIDQLAGVVDNFALYDLPEPPPVSDTNLTKTALNPGDVTPGGQVTYRFDLTNSGEPFDLSYLAGSSPGVNSFVIDFFPADLTFVSEDSDDVDCMVIGTGIALGPALADHQDYNVMNCGWTGAPAFLNDGETYSFTMTFDVAEESNMDFVNYAISIPRSTDPDYIGVVSAFTSGNDVINELSSNPNANFSAASLVEDVPSTTTTVPSDQAGSGLEGSLPMTGTSAFVGIVTGIGLCVFGLALRKRKRKIYI